MRGERGSDLGDQAGCGTHAGAARALAIQFAADEFVWGLAAIAQLVRLPFDPALALAASPPPLTLASFITAVRALGARCDALDVAPGAPTIAPGGGVAPH